jgi:hypothetical protein
MKTARRQELRTNELAQQIDQIGDYVKQNMTAFTTVVLAAAVIVAGVFWFMKSRQNKLMDAWSSVGSFEMNEDPGATIDRLQGVIDQNIDRALTAEAIIKMGNVAMMQLVSPNPAAASQPVQRDWAKIADKAFAQIASEYGDRKMAAAHAKIALGVLAENRGEMDRARSWYKQVAEDKSLAESPLLAQAEYRLKNMDEWSAPVVFPPPPPMVMLPPSPSTQPADGTLSNPFELTGNVKMPAGSSPPVRVPAGSSTPPVKVPAGSTPPPSAPPPAAPPPAKPPAKGK